MERDMSIYLISIHLWECKFWISVIYSVINNLDYLKCSWFNPQLKLYNDVHHSPCNHIYVAMTFPNVPLPLPQTQLHNSNHKYKNKRDNFCNIIDVYNVLVMFAFRYYNFIIENIKILQVCSLQFYISHL